jgi:hypothetical protein
METQRRKPGRPKASQRTLPLVLDGDRSQRTLEVAIPESTAATLDEYAEWVRQHRNMTAEEATTATIDYALREVFRRDRLWRNRGKGEGEATGRPPGPAAPRSFPTALPEPRTSLNVTTAARPETPASARVPPTPGKV